MSYLIANQSTGLERDLRPWLIPEDAYVNLLNSFIYRGRTEKRKGAYRLGSLSLSPAGLPALLPGVLAAGSNLFALSGTIAGMFGVVPGTLIVQLSVGPTTLTDSQENGTLQSSGSDPITATINYFTTDLEIIIPAGSPLIGSTVTVTSVKTFPALLAARTPCMGIWMRTLASINFEETIFFDQIYAYRFTATGFNRVGAATWTGNNSDFFWCINARNPLDGNTTTTETSFFFATNFNLPDPIRYLDSTDTWTDYTPTLYGAVQLLGARCIVQFKNRLLFFNTWEGPAPANPATAFNFPNRCRYSWLGNITDQANAFLQSPTGKGGFIDAAIAEQIVSVSVLKDCILVKFETVSWRLVYTGNPYLPFEWQKINQDFGSDSTFSSIQFDDYTLNVGNRAVTKDTSLSVQRIDDKVPDEVFDISNDNNNPKRVWGIRNFRTEQAFWIAPYPSESHAIPAYPNYVLNYSYRTGAFSFFKDLYTALGRFQNSTYYTWGDTPFTWGEAPFAWGDPAYDYGYENITAGNQQGNIFLLQSQTENDLGFEIELITVNGAGDAFVTVTNHGLDYGDFVSLDNVQGFNYANTVIVASLPAASVSYSDVLPTTTLINVSQSSDTLPPKEGKIIPGTVFATYTDTVPALTVEFYDNGLGALVATVAGYSGTVDYVSGAIQFVFPPVPGGLNVASIVISYEYSLFNGRIFSVITVTPNSFQLGSVQESTDELVEYKFPITLPIDPFTFGQYAYLTDFAISTKQFNPLIKQDTTLNIPWVDVYMDGTKGGKISVEVRSDDLQKTINPPINTYTSAQWTLSTVSPNVRFWQRIFANARGEFVQLHFTMSNQQMLYGYSFFPFVLHGLNLNIQPSGRLIRVNYT